MDDSIEVTGHGQATGSPDLALLNLRVQAERESVAAALAAVADGVRTVLACAADHRDQGVPTPRTQGLNLSTRHDRGDRTVVGYTATQQLRLSTPGTDLAGTMITALSEAAGDTLRIDGLSLSVADPTELQASARETAFSDAHARAEQFARLAGRSLGAVRGVRDVPDVGGPGPRLARTAALGDGAMPIEGGEHTVTATVTVRWELS